MQATPTRDPARLTRSLLSDGLHYGRDRSAGPLTLIAVRGTLAAAPYVLAADAVAAGTFAIEEVAEGHVQELVAHNEGDRPVLLVDGEHLEGAKQDRIVNTTILVAAGTATLIPVSCVEHGRWAYRGGVNRFQPREDHANAGLRALKAKSYSLAERLGRRMTDQGAVWDEVERTRAGLGAGSSRTGSLADALGARVDGIAGILHAAGRPSEDQTGVLACADGRVLALDVFDRPETLARLWSRLVRGYAVDALQGRGERRVREVTAAREFRGALAGEDLEITTQAGVGLGTGVIAMSPRVLVNALVWDGAMVHLAAYRRNGSEGVPTSFR
jgi:hypothetical protein